MRLGDWTCRFAIAAMAAMLTPAVSTAQATVWIPTNLSAPPGGTVNIPINLNITGNFLDAAHGNGLGGVSFIVTYNPVLLGSVGTLSLGSMIATGSFGFQGFTTNNTAGTIRAVSTSTVGTNPLAAGTSGNIAMIPFTLSSNAAPGVYAITLVGNVGSMNTALSDNVFSPDYTLNSNPGLTLASGSVTVTPEPGSLLLVSACLSFTAWRLRHRRR